MKHLLYLTLLLVFACSSPKPQEEPSEPKVENPAAEGFNKSSDAKAIAIADKTMKAMGGRENWDNTRFFYWNFFGVRTLLWDKFSGDVRIEYLKEDKKVIVNEKTGLGKVWKDGTLLENQDSINFYVQKGKEAWINDSYWLVMPFKLKDSGVTLSYISEDTTMEGEGSDVIRLTFDQVGVTPQNAYNVWVSKEDDFVKQWAWYVNAADTAARFTLPWGNYQKMGDIFLSDDRGGRDLTEVKVLSEVPEGVFESFEKTL